MISLFICWTKFYLSSQTQVKDCHFWNFFPPAWIQLIPYLYSHSTLYWLPWWLGSKESACNAGEARDAGSIPRSGKSLGGGHGNPLQHSESPWTEESGGLQSIGLQRGRHDWSGWACMPNTLYIILSYHLLAYRNLLIWLPWANMSSGGQGLCIIWLYLQHSNWHMVGVQ